MLSYLSYTTLSVVRVTDPPCYVACIQRAASREVPPKEVIIDYKQQLEDEPTTADLMLPDEVLNAALERASPMGVAPRGAGEGLQKPLPDPRLHVRDLADDKLQIICLSDSSFGMKNKSSKKYRPSSFRDEIIEYLGRNWHNTNLQMQVIGGATLHKLRAAARLALETNSSVRIALSWQFNDFFKDSHGNMIESLPANFMSEVRSFAQLLASGNTVSILGADKSVWSAGTAYDTWRDQVAAVFTSVGAVWLDGTGLFAPIPKADLWHAENNERTRKAFAAFVAQALDMGEFVNAGKAMKADLQTIPLGFGTPWGAASGTSTGES